MKRIHPVKICTEHTRHYFNDTILATDTTPEIKITGTDIYEWLPGEFILLNKADVLVGEDKNKTFEIIGYDNEIGKLIPYQAK